METVTDFIFLGSKITVHDDCSHEIKRHLLLGRKAITNLHSILKSINITLPKKIHLVKGMVFPVVMYRGESWSIKKAEHHAKMGTIKDRNGRDLTEAEDIKKRWQEYTEELYKKDLHDPDNHDGVITHLESDILECEVRWALGSITTNKASGGDRIPVELFQILKDDTVKVLHSICQEIWKTHQ